jgi:hypothetical protein
MGHRHGIAIPPMASTFDTLPIEIVHRISDFVSVNDLDEFRLTSHYYEEILNGRHKHYKLHYRNIGRISRAISKPMYGNEECMTVTIDNRNFNKALARQFKGLCGAKSLRKMAVVFHPCYYHAHHVHGPNRITDGALLARQITHISERSKSLQVLSLTFLPDCPDTGLHVDAIGVSGLGAIGGLNVLPYLRKLHLDLHGAKIGDAGAQALSALGTSPGLEILNLGLYCNQIGPEGAKAIALFNESRSLRELFLDLAFNVLGDAGTIALAALGQARGIRQLHIDLQGNKISNLGIGALTQLHRIPDLSDLTLNLSGNLFGASGVAAFASQCDGNVESFELNLSSNAIDATGIDALVGKLGTTPALRWLYLDLRCTGIDIAGGRALLKLMDAPALRDLHLLLELNEINDACVRVLSGLVRVQRCPVSLHLGLRANHITAAGVDSLIAMLHRAGTQTLYINLAHNGIHEASIWTLRTELATLARHGQVHVINLNHNPMSLQTRAELKRSLPGPNPCHRLIWSEEAWADLCGVKRVAWGRL